MSNTKNIASTMLTKREFLMSFAAAGGASAAFVAMNALGMNSASAASMPPVLEDSGKRKKVVILGAGISGMTAAYELSQRGYKVKLLEARSFSGGRCQTARNGHEWTDVKGETFRCEFDKDEYLNHGPWRIPADHQSTLYYVKKFNVPMEVMINYNEDVFLSYASAKGGLKNKRVRLREVMADMRGSTAELLAKVADQGKLDELMDSNARDQLVEYLISEGYLDKKDLNYKGTRNRGYKVSPGPGTNPGVLSDLYSFDDLLASGLGNNLHSISSQIMFQPVGGMDMIARAFDKRVGRWITHNAEVLEIRQDDNGVRIPYTDTRTGKVREEKADYCISTIPPTIINKLPLDLDDQCISALKAPTGFSVSKLGLQMNRRFWEEDDHIYGGQSKTDTAGNNSLSYPSQGFFSNKGILLAGYNFGGGADKLSGMTNDERIEVALENGEMLHPGQFRKHYDNKYAYKAWHTTKYSMGGWESWSSEARKDLYPILSEPQGRVYFSGVYTTYRGGWLAGAVESAWSQVEKLHKAVMAG